jgi:hypothetical protein
MSRIGVNAVAYALELEVVGRPAGGEHGAVAVSDVDGAHRPERLTTFVPEIERHLAWQWRAPVR